MEQSASPQHQSLIGETPSADATPAVVSNASTTFKIGDFVKMLASVNALKRNQVDTSFPWEAGMSKALDEVGFITHISDCGHLQVQFHTQIGRWWFNPRSAIKVAAVQNLLDLDHDYLPGDFVQLKRSDFAQENNIDASHFAAIRLVHLSGDVTVEVRGLILSFHSSLIERKVCPTEVEGNVVDDLISFADGGEAAAPSLGGNLCNHASNWSLGFENESSQDEVIRSLKTDIVLVRNSLANIKRDLDRTVGFVVAMESTVDHMHSENASTVLQEPVQAEIVGDKKHNMFCAVAFCESSAKSVEVSFFRFPGQPLLGHYLRNMHLDERTLTPSSRICSRHFEPECLRQTIENGEIKWMRKHDAIPTILAPNNYNSGRGETSANPLFTNGSSPALPPKADSLAEVDLDPDNAITIENGCFAWDNSSAFPTLRGITLKVPRGSLFAIAGQVGSGKSSMLSAILGEIDVIQSDRLEVSGRIAYVPQQPLVENGTLRNNVTLSQPFDEESYKRVIDACALGRDLDILPERDQTEIGQQGINLSGSQKQRVCLARAVYQNADIYLLDDPLSDVNSLLAQRIFQEIIGSNGLLKDKTRVLVTLSLNFLKYADHVAVLKDGKISEVGSYEELIQSRGVFSEFVETLSKRQDTDDKISDDKQRRSSADGICLPEWPMVPRLFAGSTPMLTGAVQNELNLRLAQINKMKRRQSK